MKTYLLGCLVAVSAAFAAHAENTTYQDYTWCGLGADNNFNTAANWVGGVKPYDWNYATIPSGDWTINIPEKGCSIISLTLAEGGGTLTLTGSGTLSIIGYGGSGSSKRPAEFVIPEGWSVVVDGPKLSGFLKYDQRGDVTIKNGAISITGSKSSIVNKVISGDAKLWLEHGDFTSDSAYLYVSNRAEVIVQDGDFINRQGVNFYDDSRFLMVGGSYQAFYGYYTVYEMGGRSTCACWGGMIRGMESTGSAAHMQTREFMKMAPKKGCRLVFPGGTPGGAIDLSTSKGSYPFEGEIYLTNRTTATSGAFRTQSYAGLTGGGALYATYLNLNPASNNGTSEWNLRALYLGAGGIGHNNHSSVNYHFRDGNLFGSFADWTFFNEPEQSFYFNLHGPLTFDTLNCFGDTNEVGEVLTHTISGSHVKLATVTDFRAVGGGTVDLVPTDTPVQLRTLEIAADTTVRFTNCTMKLKAMNLRMGAGATLAIDLSKNSYVDASSTVSFGTGAKIVVTALPATLAEGRRYPICLLPAKKGGRTAAEFPEIDFGADLPEGWSVGYTANSAYLTDGNPLAVTEGWTGGGADNNIATKANWTSGKAPVDGDALKFYGTEKTTINVAAEQKVGNFQAGANAGPFVFTGEPLRFRYPNSNSTWEDIYYSPRNDSAFPMVIENDVGTTVATSLGLWFESYGEGSLAVLGDSLDLLPLHFGGDVRLGGTYTATTLACTPNYGSGSYVSRRSSLTVMPGAKLTVTAQAGSQDYNGGDENFKVKDFFYAVATNGEMTVDGTDFTFARAATHFVDGALTVNCPFVTPVLQTFRGDGTLRLDDARGNADDFAGGVRLEGNLTFVPGAWADNLTLSVKDNVTFAPLSDWTYANTTNLVLDGNSKLTLATGGHKVTFASPIVSDGEVAVTGAGRLVLDAPGTRLWKLTCADGATVGVTEEYVAEHAGADKFADVLAVRRLDDSLEFADNLRVKMRYEIEVDSYVYSAKIKPGMLLMVR